MAKKEAAASGEEKPRQRHAGPVMVATMTEGDTGPIYTVIAPVEFEDLNAFYKWVKENGEPGVRYYPVRVAGQPARQKVKQLTLLERG